MTSRSPRVSAFRPRVEQLEDRVVPVTALLVNGTLAIVGTDGSDSIVVSRNAAGDILLDPDGAGPAGAATAAGATIFNTHAIDIRTFLNKPADKNDLIVLDFTNGLFGTAGKNDVNIRVDSGDTSQDNLWIRGTLLGDRFDVGKTNGVPHINLDGDGDVDVVTNGVTLEYIIYGQGGNDRINAAGSLVTGSAHTLGIGLVGGPGNDTLLGGKVFNTFIGGPGNDLMIGREGIDRFFFAGGFLGSDVVRDMPGTNGHLVFTDTSKYWGDFAGPTRVNLGFTGLQIVNPIHLKLTLPNAGIDHVIGSPFNDVLVGNARGNQMQGGLGSDIIHGLGGNDFLHGEGEWLAGLGGDDKLYGGAGDDHLWGGWGRDWLYGGFGSDHLNGGEAAKPNMLPNVQDGTLDLVFGQAGMDKFVFASIDVFDKAANEVWVLGP